MVGRGYVGAWVGLCVGRGGFISGLPDDAQIPAAVSQREQVTREPTLLRKLCSAVRAGATVENCCDLYAAVHILTGDDLEEEDQEQPEVRHDSLRPVWSADGEHGSSQAASVGSSPEPFVVCLEVKPNFLVLPDLYNSNIVVITSCSQDISVTP